MRNPSKNCTECPKCKNTWFEQVVCQQYNADTLVLLGQPPAPAENAVPFVLLRCLKCRFLLEPKALRQYKDGANLSYNHLLYSIRDQEIKTDKV